ncbi:MAG TPA: GNAT family N-acetyltransferase [Bacteroidia bacterium]|nr:GNAT family N-acetyltransferase [Bacteroidia bacterium]
MLVQQTDTETKGKFFIEENGIRVATMTYTHAGPGKIIIDHTEVDSSQEGKGLGKLLVKAGVDYARANNLKILPLCPYAKKVMERAEEYQDVLF